MANGLEILPVVTVQHIPRHNSCVRCENNLRRGGLEGLQVAW